MSTSPSFNDNITSITELTSPASGDTITIINTLASPSISDTVVVITNLVSPSYVDVVTTCTKLVSPVYIDKLVEIVQIEEHRIDISWCYSIARAQILIEIFKVTKHQQPNIYKGIQTMIMCKVLELILTKLS